MELHARDARAVLIDVSTRTEVDPATLSLADGLIAALHEWAEVVDAVELANGTGEAVYRRGKQLAARLAAALDAPVQYVNPVSGESEEISAPKPRPAPVVDQQVPAPAAVLRAERPSGEPTPWATGLTVSAFTTVIVVVALVALAQVLNQVNMLLVVLANVVLAAGVAPSLWLSRNVPVWRWVCYGVTAGIVISWLVLLLSLLAP